MTRSRTLSCAAVVAIAVGGVGTTVPAAAITAHQAACPDFTGPAWSFPEFGKQGTNWKVTARGVGCPFATRWAKKLLKTHYRGEAATRLAGPGGWRCTPSIPHGGGVPGECRKGKKLFAWGPHA